MRARRTRRIAAGPVLLSGAITLACRGDSADAARARSRALGAQVYVRCAACHQPDGSGVPAVFPPLAGSEWVLGPADLPIAIVLHGVQGPIAVRGKTYDNSMLAYGTTAPLSDGEVAAVLTYVRTSWGNAAPAVSAADVARVRAATAARTTQWTPAALDSLR